MDLTFHKDDLDSADVIALLDLHFTAMRGASPPHACHVLTADSLRDPAITFWSARHGGALLAVGALKELDPSHGEVKSMRTAPGSLGQGVGGKLLDHIVAEARRRGYARLSLETGNTAEFTAALSLYKKHGFRPGPPFGGYPETEFTRFLSMHLG